MKEVITVITTISTRFTYSKKNKWWGWSFCQLSLYCELLQIRNLVAFTILGWSRRFQICHG